MYLYNIRDESSLNVSRLSKLDFDSSSVFTGAGSEFANFKNYLDRDTEIEIKVSKSPNIYGQAEATNKVSKSQDRYGERKDEAPTAWSQNAYYTDDGGKMQKS